MNSKSRKFKVWSNVLQEQNLCEDLNKIGIVKNLDEKQELERVKNQRGVESYLYKDEYHLKNPKSSMKNHLKADNEMLYKTSINDKTIQKRDDNSNLLNRLGPKVVFDQNKSRQHIKVSECDLEETIVKEICKYLNEPNSEIINRCVKILGKKKSLELLYATEDILEKGGMLTSDGYRLRTPGGTYLQLVKLDDTILKCQRSQILVKEEHQKKKKNAIKRLKQKLKFEKAKQALKQKIDSDTILSGNNDRLESNQLNESQSSHEKTNDYTDDLTLIKEDEMICFDE